MEPIFPKLNPPRSAGFRLRRGCRSLLGWFCALMVGFGLVERVYGQWMTQTVDLKAGWNGVFLHVDASHANILDVLSTDPLSPIEEVWRWQPNVAAGQFVQGPQVPTSEGSQWLSWKRAVGAPSDLKRLTSNAAYLVRIRSDVATYAWSVKGRPEVPRYEWTSSGLNFLGFPTAPATPPKFEGFLAKGPAALFQSLELFQYVGGELGAGNPGPVFALSTTPVRRGEAFWLRSGTYYNNYFGPFEIKVRGDGKLDFRQRGGASSVRLRNQTASSLTVTLQLLASEAAPFGEASIAGTPALLIRGALNTTNLTYGYSSLPPGGSQNFILPAQGQPGSDIEVVVGLDRASLVGSPGDKLAGVLRFTDSLNHSQIDVGVSAEIGSSGGLWVGGAAVTQVGHYLVRFDRDSNGKPIVTTNGNYSIQGTNTSLGAVSSPYPLRLIVHQPSSGSARLLQQVFTGLNGSTNPIVTTHESMLAREHLAKARRISAAHLPWSQANTGWLFSGALAQNATLSVAVTNSFDNHASNPFLHTYHPDHDNLDTRFKQEVPQGSESYTIVRDIIFKVSPPDDDFGSKTSFGQSISGEYLESVRVLGLARAGGGFDTRTFMGSGRFELNRLSEISSLTTPP